MTIDIPKSSLVLLIGSSSAGKSTFARRHFKTTQVLSSDYCRALVADDENDQAATKDAFEVLHLIAEKRLSNQLLTVIDATNVQEFARASLLQLAKKHDCSVIAIVLNLPESILLKRNQHRFDRDLEPDIIRKHVRQLKESLNTLKAEGFCSVYEIKTENGVENVEINVVEQEFAEKIY